MHQTHFTPHPDVAHHDTLHAVIVCSNPVRYQSRYKLHRDMIARLAHGTHHSKHKHPVNLNVIVVEIAFGERPFEITQASNPNHVQLRTYSELWHKESMIVQGVQRLTQLVPKWGKMAWIDGDVEFQHPNWVMETLAALDHYEVVQMWQDAIDLGPNYEALERHKSFLSQYHRGVTRPQYGTYGKGEHWHPGFAWAMTREAYDLVGIYDKSILGASDNHMAYGLLGIMEESFPKLKDKGVSSAYADDLMLWGLRAEKYINRDVGYVPGTIYHHWHGKKRDRRYWDRWQILVNNDYHPHTDIKRDAQGLYVLDTHTERQRALRDQIRTYFRVRNEDSVDVT